jgi:hypothetical protein
VLQTDPVQLVIVQFYVMQFADDEI